MTASGSSVPFHASLITLNPVTYLFTAWEDGNSSRPETEPETEVGTRDRDRPEPNTAYPEFLKSVS